MAQQWEQIGQSFLYDIVSKTACREFKSYYPCQTKKDAKGIFFVCLGRVDWTNGTRSVNVWGRDRCLNGRCRERNEAQCSNDNKPFRRCSWSLLSTRGRSLSSLTTPAKKKDIHWMSFFSYICLWQVILLRSYIRLTPSDIVLSHSIKAKIISLKLEVSISLLIYQKYHSIEDGISLFLHQFSILFHLFPMFPSATSSF